MKYVESFYNESTKISAKNRETKYCIYIYWSMDKLYRHKKIPGKIPL